jgi:integrase
VGNFPDWSTSAARDEAKALKRRVDRGEDPMGERHEERAAPTVGDLIDRFKAEHLPKRRPSTIREYTSILDKLVRPELGRMKVADVEHIDIDRLHRKISQRTPYRANRMAAVVSKMMNFAVKLKWRTDNPVRGLERNPEDQRERYLSPQELAALAAALAGHSDERSADAIRMLMLTGARRGEVLGATWDQFDLAAGTWVKPSSHTKQKKPHRVPLSAPAVALLSAIWERQKEAQEKARRAGMPVTRCPYVFPGDKPDSHLTEVKKSWAVLISRATVLLWADRPETSEGQLVTRLRQAKGKLPTLRECQAAATAESRDLPARLTDARLHDLRHSFASVLVSGGESLPLIGAMLGHTQVSTTKRYSHLFDDPLRAAAERVGAVWEAAHAGRSAEVVPLQRKR